ncbi:uncharacterized protein PRCAT00002407001 [Priceomyces carsonii]|uniref:uncharacterized protein n=1 Tax=Priceomyces carsonii TaxID=28549 RepID=UPI002ED7907D|nr:unnamed protein product [Priceomyces carsonii]
MPVQSQYISVISMGTVEDSSWVYLVDWILALIIGFAFVFYFHRCVGWLISELLRLLLWKRHRIKITFESLKISFLGGRIFAKNLTIITTDQTVSILKLSLTWRYWIFNLTRLPEYYFESKDEILESMGYLREDNERLPCRILLMIEGLEIFMYNRRTGYDNIINILNEEELKDSSSKMSGSSSFSDSNSSLRSRTSNLSSNEKSSPPSFEKPLHKEGEKCHKMTNYTLKFLLKVFPINVRIKKGAIVVGNSTTPSILVMSYKSADSIFDVSKAPNYLDFYRLQFSFDTDSLQMSIKPNITFDKNHSKTDIRNRTQSRVHKHKNYQVWKSFQKAVKFMTKTAMLKRSKSQKKEDPGSFQWMGLKRYVGDTSGDEKLFGIAGADEEYARYTLILDSSRTKLTYYYDVPGYVPYENPLDGMSPQFGINIELSMATIHYGPWADKQRIPIQTMFFPPISHDSKPTEIPKPGYLRSYEGFKIQIHVKDEAVLRIPVREPSKDKELLKGNLVANMATRASRPFGWLELKTKTNSTVTSFTSYVASKEIGWPNTLNAFFCEPEVRTSVNHDILFAAKSHRIDGKIGFPLKWNGKCDWTFDFSSNLAKVFFLREHTMLFSDIFSDFGSGTPTPYEYHRPFQYNINWKVENYKFFLNINDCNIINNPLDFVNNKYLSFQGKDLECQLCIPLNGQFSKSTTIDYKIDTSFFNFVLDNPMWHTTHSFLNDSNIMGRSNNFTIEGSYTFFNSVEVNTSNFVVIKCIGDSITLKLYGFVVRYFFSIKENYFGHFIHFKTFEEYNNGLEPSINTDGASSAKSDMKKDSENADIDYWKIIRTDNDMDFLFTFQVRRGLLVLPYHLFDCSSHIGLSFDYLDIDFRFNDYYVDLQADFSPISAKFIHDPNESYFDLARYIEINDYAGSPDLTFDGFTIHTHRMLGFVPISIMYYCKWDFASGEMNFDCSISFWCKLMESIERQGFSFKDLENGLNVPAALAYDIANFSFRCPRVNMRLRGDEHSASKAFLSISLESILATFNNSLNHRYSNKMALTIPLIEIKLIDEIAGTISAFIKTSLNFTNIEQAQKMDEHRRLHEEHLRANDAPFHRASFLLSEEYRDEIYNTALGSHLTSLTLPTVSCPLKKETEPFLLKKRPSSSDTEDVMTDDSSLYSMEDEFRRMHPTNSYEDQDFAPSHKTNPKFIYHNLIFDVGDVSVFFTPSSLQYIAEMLETAGDLTVESLMDTLNIKTVLNLNRLMNPVDLILNYRFVTQEILLKFIDREVLDPMEVFERVPKVPVITLKIVEPSFAFSSVEDTSHGGSMIDEKDSNTCACHIKEVFLSISNISEFTLPLYLSINDIEIWLTKDELEDVTGSFIVDSIDFQINSSQIEWTVKFFMDIYKKCYMSVARLKNISELNSMAIGELVYKLALASTTFHVDHDPTVLTKPTYILRSKKAHVRFYDSWKLMTRLRHILRNCPRTWKTDQNNLLTGGQWDKTASARQKVEEIFHNWRSWEANEDERKDFFDLVFKSKRHILLMLNFRFRVSNVNMKLIDGSKRIDFISLRDVNTSLKALDSDSNDFSLILEPGKSLEIINNIAAVNSKLSTIFLESYVRATKAFQNISDDLVSCRSRNQGKNEGKDSNVGNKGKENIKLDVISNLMTLQLEIKVRNSTMTIKFSGLAAALLYDSSRSSKESLFDLSSEASQFDAKLWNNTNQLLNIKITDICFGLANEGLISLGSKIANASIGTMSVQVPEGGDESAETTVSFVREDLKYLKQFNLLKSSNKNEDLDLWDSLGSISVDFAIGDFSFIFGMLKPLKLDLHILESQITLSIINKIALFESKVEKVFWKTVLGSISMIEVENSLFNLNARVTSVEESILANMDLGLGYTKVFIPNIINSFFALNNHIEHLLKTIGKLRLQFLNSEDDESQRALVKDKNAQTIEKSLMYKVNTTVDYIGISTVLNNAKFSFELEDITLGTHNVANVARSSVFSQEKVPSHGEIEIPSARFSIVDRSVPVRLSNVFDINLSVSILNDGDIENMKQSLQIESQYFRVCLCPQVIFKMIEMTDFVTGIFEMKSFLDKFKLKVKGPKKLDRAFPFSSVHVLSYKFCIGFLFGGSEKDYPGIILGAERFYAITQKHLGKFTLIDAYMSVARGQGFSNFYSTESEKGNLNRSFLPNLQLTYSINDSKDGKDMRISMLGDELDVKFLSDSFVILDHLLKSSTVIQNYLLKRAQNPRFHRTKKEMHPQTDYMRSINSIFASIEVYAKFAGANVMFHRLNDEWDLKRPPALLLHSPAVQIASLYQHKKESSKKHFFKTEVLTSSSDNTLYASCVPVMVDIIYGVKKMMRKLNSKSGIRNKPTNEPAKDIQLGNLLRDMDIYLGVKIENQKVSLRCEPIAEVAAVVGIDGIYIQLYSGNGDIPALVSAVQIESVSASLQHIYSREISGSITLKHFILTSSFEFKKKLSILSASSLSDIEAYVNIKQYQDLDIFKDIWIPKLDHFDKTEEDSNTLKNANDAKITVNKKMSSRFKEVSTTYAIPGALTLIISNISLKADFGPSLGNFTLKLDEFFAVSKKSTDWAHDLKLGINSVSLISEGRLGGIFSVSNIRLHMAVNWMLDMDTILDVPLILVSGRIEKLQVRASFDYHVFAIVNVEDCSIDIYNQKSSVIKDHLFIQTGFKCLEIFVTSLAASTILDIHHTVDRMVEDNRRSYKETLHDSSKSKGDLAGRVHGKKMEEDILEATKKLETKIEVIAGRFFVQVYPSSFNDSKVLVFTLDESKANFQQNEYKSGISNNLELRLNDLKVSLSGTTVPHADYAMKFSIDDFVGVARKAKGGALFVFPSLKISMRTFQKYNTNVIEYFYQSSFGGTVDIRWNLGSINFIREMYSVHKKALDSRIEYRKTKEGDIAWNERMFDVDSKHSPATIPDSIDQSTGLDRVIGNTLNRVSSESKFDYLPLAPPIIEAPQLRDLGNATPPLEWFGLHRNNFPNFTHEVGIVTLQKLVHEVEHRYSKILGRA